MHILEYPYAIITILAIVFLVMCLIGLYFTVKSVKTAKETPEKSFCGMGKIVLKGWEMHAKTAVLYISQYRLIT